MSATSSFASSVRAQEGSMLWDSATMQLFPCHLHTQQHRVGGDISTPGPGFCPAEEHIHTGKIPSKSDGGN